VPTIAERLILNQLLDSERKPPDTRRYIFSRKILDTLRSLKEAGNATTPFPRANAGELQLVSVVLVLGPLT
jgi:hypothetical protein